MPLTKTPEIFTHFDALQDPRVERTKLHSLSEMIVIALCGAICGADGWVDVERFGKTKIDWLKRFLELENGVPSHDTFGRVFAGLDTGELLSAMHAWVDAFARGTRMGLRPMSVDAGSNEIPTVPAWRKLLEQGGATETISSPLSSNPTCARSWASV